MRIPRFYKVLVFAVIVAAISTGYLKAASTKSGVITDVYFDEYDNAIVELQGSGSIWVGCTAVLLNRDYDFILEEIDVEPKQVSFGNSKNAKVTFYSAEASLIAFSRWTTGWYEDRVCFIFALWEDKLTKLQYIAKYKTFTTSEAFKYTDKSFIMDGLLSRKWIVDQYGFEVKL